MTYDCHQFCHPFCSECSQSIYLLTLKCKFQVSAVLDPFCTKALTNASLLTTAPSLPASLVDEKVWCLLEAGDVWRPKSLGCLAGVCAVRASQAEPANLLLLTIPTHRGLQMKLYRIKKGLGRQTGISPCRGLLWIHGSFCYPMTHAPFLPACRKVPRWICDPVSQHLSSFPPVEKDGPHKSPFGDPRCNWWQFGRNPQLLPASCVGAGGHRFCTMFLYVSCVRGAFGVSGFRLPAFVTQAASR